MSSGCLMSVSDFTKLGGRGEYGVAGSSEINRQRGNAALISSINKNILLIWSSREECLDTE